MVPLFLALYGYGTIDVADFARMSAHPLLINPEPRNQFLHSSALPYFLGYPFTTALGARPAFAIVMLGGVAFCLAALRWFTRVRYAARGNDAMLMFLAAPLLIVLTQYLGKSDPYLAAFLFVTLGAVHPVLQIVMAALAVLSHREMGTIILVLCVFLGLARPRVLAGAVIGIALIYAYHHVLLSAPPQSRSDLGAVYLRDAISIVLTTPVQHAVWTFGPFWWCITRAWPLDWRWLTTVAVALGFATATLDFTRVFVLVSLPAVIAVVDRIVARLNEDRDEPAWLASLPFFAFVQSHLLSLAAYDSRMPEVLSRLTGWLNIQH